MTSPPSPKNRTARVLASLRHTRDELREGRRLLKATKKRATKAKGLARDNARRAAELIDKTVDSLEDHQDLLIKQVVGPTSAARSQTKEGIMPKKAKRKYSRSSGKEVKSEMHRYKHGKAKSGRGGKGGKVKSRKQAIAIGLSKARKKGKKVPKKK
jgi:Family of unknown function (DUF6496)